MTLVTEERFQAAFDYINEEPHPLVGANIAVLRAENNVELIFARLYLQTEGTVKERECRVIIDISYQNAKASLITAQGELLEHKQRKEKSGTIIECWRTEQSNIRAAERVR